MGGNKLNSTNSTPAPRAPRKLSPWWWGLALLVVAGGIFLWLRGGAHRDGDAATFATRRGPLNITVLEGGSVQALESQEIKCEVRVGYQGLKILKIVEEGYEVTDDDIKTNKVLVELDSSKLRQNLVQQDISFQSTLSSLSEAQQRFEIQLNQNKVDIKAAEQGFNRVAPWVLAGALRPSGSGEVPR
jgi:multidrug efflux pump subunit AcrA (membrane-fusion protein)